jgi:hypothetical protein
MRDALIVEETRELDAEFGGDLGALWKYLKQIEAENADRLVKLVPKPALPTNRKAS